MPPHQVGAYLTDYRLEVGLRCGDGCSTSATPSTASCDANSLKAKAKDSVRLNRKKYKKKKHKKHR